MDTKKTLTLDQPALYRLCLNGHVSADWSDWLTNIVVAFKNDQTLISGVVRDQAALFGLLSFVRDLGAPLVSVEFLPYQDQKEKTMNKNITKIALKGIAMAMGVAVIVLSTLKTLDVSSGVSMLGMGLTALALANFQE